MKGIHCKLLTLLALGLASVSAKGHVVGCSAEIDANIWNLNSLRRSQDQGDYQVVYQAAGDSGNTTINFNLCSNTYTKCNLTNGDFDDDFANYFMAKDGGKCHRLTDDDMDESQAQLIDDDKPEVGLRLVFESDEICQGKQKYGFTLDIRCDENAVVPIPRINSNSVSKNNCNPQVYFESTAGCITRSFSKMWKFFEDMVEEFGVVLIIAGLFLTFFGAKYNQVTLFIAGFTAGSLGSLFLLYFVLLPEFTPNWGHFVAFFISAIVGVMVGLLASMWTKLGVFILGGWLGGTLGMMVYNSVFAKFFASSGRKAQYWFWTTILFFVLAGAMLMVALFGHALAVGSSLVGAYALIRGISIFAGGFPNEFLVYQEIQNGSYAEMPDEFYIYLGCYVFVAIVGIIIQEREYLKTKYHERKEKKQKKNKNKGHLDHEEIKEDEEDQKPLIKRKK